MSVSPDSPRATDHDDAHDHPHGHGHDCHHGDGHSHGDTSTADGRRRVAISFVLIASFMGVEVVGGVISGSLALLADAAHMMTDAASLALAWLGYKLAARPADETRTYGFARFRVLAAFSNGLALIALSVWILIEGIARLQSPQPVMGPLLLGIAIIGLIVNLVCFAVLHGGDRNDLNLRGALWHVAGDLLGSVAAIIAAIIIIKTGWMPIDPLLSMLVALLVLVAGIRITKQAAHILAQGAPAGLTAPAIADDLKTHIAGIACITDIHIWSLTEKDTIITLIVHPTDDQSADPLCTRIRQRLADEFTITHATIEIVPPSQDHAIDPAAKTA